jgi:hypothetical protein
MRVSCFGDYKGVCLIYEKSAVFVAGENIRKSLFQTGSRAFPCKIMIWRI